LRSGDDDDDTHNDNKNSQSSSCEQHSTPNKEILSDHTHWMSGDDTDSNWASPVKSHNKRTAHKSLAGFTVKKHAGTKRSLFSLNDCSQEQLVKKSLSKLGSLPPHVCTHYTYHNNYLL